MYIPVFSTVRYVQENGYLTEEMQIYNDELNQALLGGLSDNGWTLPPISAANLAIVAPMMADGTIWYESDAKEWVGKKNGVLVKFTTTAYP
jgi:hypothetical protein